MEQKISTRIFSENKVEAVNQKKHKPTTSKTDGSNLMRVGLECANSPACHSHSDAKHIILRICQRPGMWVSPPTFNAACGFILGLDSSRDGGPLNGFHEWCVLRLRGGANVHWHRLVEKLTGFNACDAGASLEQHEAAIGRLGAIMEEFLKYREKNGVVAIYYEYARWLLKQNWYDGPLRKFRNKRSAKQQEKRRLAKKSLK